ncbi:hypothetical protein QLL95_gp0367 [Cotonvirus japonicus]|uniref:Ankyrin repeat protein n=1 Tax=Cotonvirus japonicus TaxID=2811091 RepID=A0ABM7NUI0_9VIRU|nr:hypothetical protein QLL95_gp0367 [Cotonvirus japonicus]BCS83756.1 hypothetical protein [Cotonvirus japonicus]
MYLPFRFTNQHLSNFNDEIVVTESKIIFILHRNKIVTKYNKINDIFEIQVKISDAVIFMKYIIKNHKVFHGKKIIFPDNYFFEYLIFILANDMYYHIKFFTKKFMPLVEDKISKYLYLIHNVLFNIPNNIIISTNTMCYFINKLNYNSISFYLYYGIDNFDIEVFEHILKLYGKMLKKYLTDETNDVFDGINNMVSFGVLLENVMLSKKKDVFDCVIENFSSYFDDIDLNEIPNNRKKIYYETKKDYQYDDKLIKSLLNGSVYTYNASKEIYSDIVSDCRDINYLTDFLVYDILKKERYYTSESLVDWKCYPKFLKCVLNEIDKRIGINQEYIDKLFIESYRNSEIIVKILISYGADYIKFGCKFIKRAMKHGRTYSTAFIGELIFNDSFQ